MHTCQPARGPSARAACPVSDTEAGQGFFQTADLGGVAGVEHAGTSLSWTPIADAKALLDSRSSRSAS